MKICVLRTICCSALLALAAGSAAMGQRGPGGPPPPPGGGMGGGSGPGANPNAQNPNPGGRAQKNMTPPSSAPNARAGVQFGPVGRWWDDKSVVHAVGLSTDQKRKMDTIFSASRPAILASYQTYLKEQSKLNALSHDPQASQEATFAAIDAVNLARSVLQKATAQVYLQLRQQMSSEQIQKLEKLQ